MPRYIATFIPQMTISWFGSDAYPADPKGDTMWDCTDFLKSAYTAAEVEEIVAEEVGSELTDSVRTDPAAPEWIREWDGPYEVLVEEVPDEMMKLSEVLQNTPT